jgi:methylenetetrahydrofolate dehydrogenase (NADP+)/methenyltetrahydrofolate cyclohydrolase
MTILEGKRVSSEIKLQIIEEINILKKTTGKVPGLSVVIVGENEASKVYVKSKDKMASELGIKSNVIEFDENISSDELIQKIIELNENDEVNGILIQLPLPKKFNTWEILDNISPDKDVDCFLPINLGMILLNRTTISMFPE